MMIATKDAAPDALPRAYAKEALDAEAERLHGALQHAGWVLDECRLHAPLTLEIRERAREKKAVILAHSYMTPEILYGIADFRGDSLGLSEEARKTDADVIVFCGVRFMGETAKVLSPGKTVLLPAPDAGCSLSDAIRPEDVRALRAANPGAAVVCYINTDAAVKAECDACVTSANAVDVVMGMAEERIVFVPDKLMAGNLQIACPGKTIIPWDGRCIVHEQFTPERAAAWREAWPQAKMLVHTECTSGVVGMADMAGGTGDMIDYVRKNPGVKDFMLVTECGLSDRLRIEFPDRRFIGTCGLCPHMKRVELRRVLDVLIAPRREQIVEVPEDVRVRALRSLDRMFELTKSRKGDRWKPLPMASPAEA